jgi:hypothetical protein
MFWEACLKDWNLETHDQITMVERKYLGVGY